MRGTALRFLATVVAAVGLAYAIDAEAGGGFLGKEPPEIKASGWLNTDGPVTLAAQKGKVAVVEFWATWCPPCRRSIPHIEEIFQKHQKDGLVVIGLSNEEKEKVEPFAKKMGMTYIVGWGSDSGGDYGVDTIPRAFVVGRDGKVAWTGNPLEKGFEGEIEKALGAK